MIEPKLLQNLTNKGLCYNCKKYIGEEKFYEINFLKSHAERCCWIHRKPNTTGHGAILRFCKDCWKKKAGKDFMFDECEYQ